MVLRRSALNKDLCPHGMMCFASEHSVVTSVLRRRRRVSNTGDSAKTKAREVPTAVCYAFLSSQFVGPLAYLAREEGVSSKARLNVYASLP